MASVAHKCPSVAAARAGPSRTRRARVQCRVQVGCAPTAGTGAAAAALAAPPLRLLGLRTLLRRCCRCAAVAALYV